MRTLLILLAFLLPTVAAANEAYEPYRVKRHRELQAERQARQARIAARAEHREGFVRPRVIYFPVSGSSYRYSAEYVIYDLETGEIQIMRERL